MAKRVAAEKKKYRALNQVVIIERVEGDGEIEKNDVMYKFVEII
jgi:hypothetical protein